jgi:hypothetical protein
VETTARAVAFPPGQRNSASSVLMMPVPKKIRKITTHGVRPPEAQGGDPRADPVEVEAWGEIVKIYSDDDEA